MPKTCQHNHAHINAEADASVDPTRTKSLRRKYAGKMYKRFRSLKGLVRTSVVENNALKIGDYVPYTLAAPLKPSDYKFTQDAQKITQFKQWLQQAIDDDILEATARSGGAVTARNPWQNNYVRKAYSKGVRHADQAIRRQGAMHQIEVPTKSLQNTLNAPMHQSALQTLYTRNFTELQGVTQAMDQQISRQLAQGFAEGWNPRKMATEINDRVDKIGITRARTLARTETIRTHAHAQLNRYSEYGVKKVKAKVELLTAGDARVCPICQRLEGQVWSLSRAKNVIPLHPRCRCSWTPVTQSFTG